MKRRQEKAITHDLEKKMVFVTGPRQVGKTTLSKNLKYKFKDIYYLNYDKSADRNIFLKQAWDRQASLVIFDEIHKWKKWKNVLKGVYDTEGIPPRMLVTGSARLDMFRKSGDSLAGRYLLHRLYPLSVAELSSVMGANEAMDQLLTLGGFPEPFLSASAKEAKRWRRLYIDRIIKDDIRDLTNVSDIQSLLVLVELLRERVGSPISYSSLANDLQVSAVIVKKWIGILENLYIIFLVRPYHKNISRSILKAPKVYFYDIGLVRGDNGLRLENLVALSLLKHLHYLEDTAGEETGLYYLRDKEKREVDFLTIINGKAQSLIEVKLSDKALHKQLLSFARYFTGCKLFQLVGSLDKTRTIDNVQITNAAQWLAGLKI